MLALRAPRDRALEQTRGRKTRSAELVPQRAKKFALPASFLRHLMRDGSFSPPRNLVSMGFACQIELWCLQSCTMILSLSCERPTLKRIAVDQPRASPLRQFH